MKGEIVVKNKDDRIQWDPNRMVHFYEIVLCSELDRSCLAAVWMNKSDSKDDDLVEKNDLVWQVYFLFSDTRLI